MPLRPCLAASLACDTHTAAIHIQQPSAVSDIADGWWTHLIWTDLLWPAGRRGAYIKEKVTHEPTPP